MFSAIANQLRNLFRQARGTIARLGRRIARKPRGLQKALHRRENDLQLLLASSLDPIVVMNGEHRLVDANTKALELFGISKTNLVKFTIDTFLSYEPISKCRVYHSAFIRRAEKHGKCEIRRLDGSLRLAEYIYIPNFVPFRHLLRFRHISATDQYRPATLRAPLNQPPLFTA